VPGRPVPGLPLQNRPRAEGAVSYPGIMGFRLCDTSSRVQIITYVHICI